MDKDPFEIFSNFVGYFSQENLDKNGVSIGVLFVICVILVLPAFKLLIDIVAAIIKGLQSIGFKFISHGDSRLQLRRRQQFCLVLRADLDAMAKAENWNDQWFTDLEAEVEVDGAYFSSRFAELLGRRSVGLRRIPSLVKAIASSNERCMLLVGEPGSGKSIALRHLAREMADSGAGKFGGKIKIPLYVNLKEIDVNADSVDADFIKNFILENVRRGDADTAAYVKEHWDDYKEQGVWFFLFDSFDEIPAVLHSPNGSEPVVLYTEAVRKFMDGMGGCRGVLASREYKGPGALSWSKLRILPLDTVRQDQLIENTFLPETGKSLVRQHLASKRGEIFGNPLFLSLLCRYVRATETLPAHDYDLLVRHIEDLAGRDAHYLKKKYELDDGQLLHGAKLIAVLFASRPELSLAPKFSDLNQYFHTMEGAENFELETLLAALIDVKIGRSDVKEAKPGDRRFTFSHRRYQETLFVQYLAENDNFLDKKEFLIDSRWREFAVTLLQSQPIYIVEKYVNLVVELLDSFSSEPEEIGGVSCFPWLNTTLLHILQLINEGFENRLHDVPVRLRDAIARQLNSRWMSGDLYDRLMVIRYGCLLPEEDYSGMMIYAVESRVEPLMQAVFLNARFLISFPEDLVEWVRGRFATEVLMANSKIDLHRLDALSTHFPRELGARLIFNRCRNLRLFLIKPKIFISFIFKFFSGGAGQWVDFRSMSRSIIMLTQILCFEIAAFCLISAKSAINVSGVYGVFSVWFFGVVFIASISIVFRFILRGHPNSLMSCSAVVALFKRLPRVKRKLFFVFICMSIVVFLLIGLVESWLKNNPVTFSVFLAVLSFGMIFGEIFYTKRERARVAKQLNGGFLFDGSVTAIERINVAGVSAKNMADWFELDGRGFLVEDVFARAALKFSQRHFPVPIYGAVDDNLIGYSPRLWSVLLLRIDDL